MCQTRASYKSAFHSTPMYLICRALLRGIVLVSDAFRLVRSRTPMYLIHSVLSCPVLVYYVMLCDAWLSPL